MSDGPIASVVVVSYNTREMTVAALASAHGETTRPVEFLVVDNASTDGSADAIEQACPWATLIRSERNLGFAAANNLATSRARGKYLLLLNPDTIVLDHAIDELIAFAERQPESRIWGGRTLYADRSLNPTSCWGRQTLWSLFCRASGLSNVFANSALFNPEGYGGWARDSEREVDIVTGCFFLIETSLWRTLGGFDLRFFMYGEEADLCLRAAREHGACPAITPRATIVHYGGASEKVRGDKLVRVLRARVQLLRKFWSPGAARVGTELTFLWTVRNAVLHRVLGSLGRASSREAASAWGEVVRRRAEWAVRSVDAGAPVMGGSSSARAGATL